MRKNISIEDKSIGRMLRGKRESLGLSQQEVADYVNVSKSGVSRWESGQLANMGKDKIKLLSEILKIPPATIILGVEEDDNSNITDAELINYFKNNKKKLSSLSKEDSSKIIKLIDIYLD